MYSEFLLLKYEAWKENDWHKEQKGKNIKIRNWKTTLLQCLPYRTENKVKERKTIKRKKPMTDEKKKEVHNAYKHFIDTNIVPERYSFVYDDLRASGAIKDPNLYPDYKAKKMKEAGAKLIAEALDEQKKTTLKETIHALGLRIELIQAYSPKVKDDMYKKFKCVVVEDYFRKFKKLYENEN